ncbi:alpha,alpha-trehalase TreF [Sphingomonas sp.]
MIRPLLPLAALLLSACAVEQSPPVATASVATPADRYGDLFVAVQERRIFADGKSFVDAVPKRAPEAILGDWRARGAMDDAALRAFVLANFDVPGEAAAVVDQPARPARPMLQHIRALWDELARPPVVPVAGSSALAFDGAHVVPGGRFREIYYWDSFFTMLGLKEDGRDDLIEGMIDGFVGLVERHGHVPNGARSYYISRSQPPFLYAMMGLSKREEPEVLARRLDALIAEHRYWMAGGRVVAMADGAMLNRYWDDRDTPRDESWREDIETARASGRPEREVYRHLRAGAESGWDFSSRWLADGRTLASIDTTDMVPVDLNSLLYAMERDIAARCEALARDCARAFGKRADERRAGIERWLWSADEGRYGDFDRKTGRLRAGLTAATAYPLFARVASEKRAARVAETIDARLIAPGGLRTSLFETGEQWDAPNGWAPLQWIAADGLLAYGHDGPARRIAVAWVATVQRGYAGSGRLMEKYDVERLRPGGGGEYPLQDGFGWTNGVTRAMIARWGIGD